MKKLDMTKKWAWRKVGYYAAAALIAVLGAFGVLSEVQVDQWTGEIDKIITWVLGVLAPLIAGAKTNAGSDSTATADDVAAAAAIQGPPGPMGMPTDIDSIAGAVVTAIRSEELGQHDTATSSEASDVASYYEGKL